MGRAVASPKFRVSRQAARASATGSDHLLTSTAAAMHWQKPPPRCTGKNRRRDALAKKETGLRYKAANCCVTVVPTANRNSLSGRDFSPVLMARRLLPTDQIAANRF
jgi:hypothetical protein